jgi:hypothetical protein
MGEWLVSACDRHTHETRPDTEKTFFDFDDEILIRTPIEILLVLRLRALSGLENPTLQHPLMEAPFDTLPHAEPVPADDLWMTGTLVRAERDWPNLQTTTSLERIRQWASTRTR